MAIDTQQNAQEAFTSDSRPPVTPARRHFTGPWLNRALATMAICVLIYPVWMSTSGPKNDDTTTILTHPVTRGDLMVSVTEQGTVESSHNEEIKCTVKGASTVLWVIETGTEVQPGDVLVRLDTSLIEDSINQQKIAYETALANKATAASNVEVAKIAITEYLEGTFPSEVALKKMELVVAQSNLKSAQDSYDYAKRMFRKGYISTLEFGAQKDGMTHAELDVVAKQKSLEGLERFTKQKMLRELQGVLEVAEAQLASFDASLKLEESRLVNEERQLENCVIRAETAGMVIHPQVAEWKEVPDVEEGAIVRQDQVLLMIPDLNRMQVKVAIHESKVDRIRVGMPAQIEIQDGFLRGEVANVASVARPTGWWTNNMVTYDVIINLHDVRPSLKPGMTGAAEIFLAKFEDVPTVPVAAVLEQGKQLFCWVETDDGISRRRLKIADSNDRFVVAQDGVQEGERVVLNPLDFLDDAQKNELSEYREPNVERAESKDSKADENVSSKNPAARADKLKALKADVEARPEKTQSKKTGKLKPGK